MMQSGTAFIKPFSKSVFGQENTVHYAYPREKLISEPIFPYFVLDGGAFNFANDRFSTVNGDDLLDLTMSGKLFEEFTYDGVFNWERSFAYHGGSEFEKKYEWQIWPQRLYMTIPVAQAFLRTGEKKYADAWLRIVRAWDEAHPYQGFDPAINYLKTDMVWRDMQVAWRSLSLMHGMFLLQDAPFDEATWKYLYNFLKLHIEHLYAEALDRLEKNHAQNHVLQIGVALIMAGVLYPEFEHHEEYIRIGCDTVEMNMRGAIYADGGSNEDSPSYSHFIVRLYLEAYLLLVNNGHTPFCGLRESIVRQYEWLYHCTAPSGKTLRLSDSYGMDGAADLRRAEELIPLDFPHEKKSILFPESGVAVLRCGDMMLVVDAMPFNPGHQHYGRPQILLFYKCEPILIDEGCSNYDRWELYHAVRSTAVHNVVYAFDLGDGMYDESCSIAPRIADFDAENNTVTTECRISCFGKTYVWTRKMKLSGDSLRIEDSAEADCALDWKTNLLFPRRDCRLSGDCTKFAQLDNAFKLELTSALPMTMELVPTTDDDNKLTYAEAVRSASHGKAFRNTAEIRIFPR